MKVVVLAGGTSTERDVSLMSGTGVYKALLEKGHEAVLIDVYLGYEGEGVEDVFSINKDWSEGIRSIGTDIPDMEEIRKKRADGGKSFFGPNVIDICKQADIVFMALHGANGEDGRIQATFELMGIPFTGTDYISSAVCMDKALTRKILTNTKVPMAKGFSMKVDDDVVELQYPVVAKVSTGGSSVGVYIVNNECELKVALTEAKKFDDTVVIEEYIKGREFTCGVIDGKALPIVEIAPKEGFYDFKNKYQPGKTNDICPAQLSSENTKRIQDAAELAYKELGIKAYARIDFMMDEKENIYCLEANTLPGMTPLSLLPMEAKAIGMDYPTLCEELIKVSLRGK